jgi:hypothetical protein
MDPGQTGVDLFRILDPLGENSLSRRKSEEGPILGPPQPTMGCSLFLKADQALAIPSAQ